MLGRNFSKRGSHCLAIDDRNIHRVKLAREFIRDWTPPALMRLARQIQRGALRGRLVYRVGSTNLTLPTNHALLAYRSKWRMYDEPIRMLGETLRDLRPGFRAIDIGANVGDSAAALGADGPVSVPVPVLCIEGDPAYLDYLRRNASELGPHIQIEASFVGANPGLLAIDELQRHDGTTSAARGLEQRADQTTSDGPVSEVGASTIRVRSLDQILGDHTDFAAADLIKLDTDGYDFSILLENEALLARMGPVLFFEYLVESERDSERASACLSMLTSVGYNDFLVFDNFGNLMLRTSDAAVLHTLDQYLLSNLRFGQAVFYLDVCASLEEDRDVLDGLSRRVRERVEASTTDR